MLFSVPVSVPVPHVPHPIILISSHLARFSTVFELVTGTEERQKEVREEIAAYERANRGQIRLERQAIEERDRAMADMLERRRREALENLGKRTSEAAQDRRTRRMESRKSIDAIVSGKQTVNVRIPVQHVPLPVPITSSASLKDKLTGMTRKQLSERKMSQRTAGGFRRRREVKLERLEAVMTLGVALPVRPSAADDTTLYKAVPSR